ncbi:two-component regulator propeller domain-containing protein [Crocosphaera sp.]|uniref:two-component regulator propeller domain-containing protein n=1 Tax=Crocosphaera sp. TaxID=2729996 RepID=UPI003F1E84F2|nr:two-component regulator propeller domain-containing protein [Crocosphaera sp.]
MIFRSIKQIICAITATATLGTIFPVNAQIAVRIPDQELPVNRIYQDQQGRLWLGTEEKGAYRLNPEKNEASLINSTQELSVRDIYEDQQRRLWLGTKKGAYRLNPQNNQVILITSTQKASVRGIYEDQQGELWLKTDQGVYDLNPDSNQASLITSTEGLSLRDIYKDKQGRIWIGTQEKGAYRLDPKNNQAIPINLTQRLAVTDIYEDKQGELWLGTDQGAYRLDPKNNQASLIEDTEELSVTDIYEDKQERLWLGTDQGAYRLDPENNKASLIESTQGFSFMDKGRGIYEDKQGRLWLRTDQGVYRLEPQKNLPIPINFTQELPESSVRDISEDKEGRLWLGTKQGAYRYDENLKIDVVVESGGNAGILVNLLSNIFPSIGYISPLKLKACYTYIDSNCYDNNQPDLESFSREFFVIFQNDNKPLFDHTLTLKDKGYKAMDNGIREELIQNGEHKIYIGVRDKWGNISGVKTQTIFVGGWEFLTGIGATIIVIASWVSSAIALIIAPYNQFSHDLLMNPFLRNYASFGFIPIALSVIPPLRNYILRRYLKQVRKDEQFSRWREEFIVPSGDFIPENFGEKFQQKQMQKQSIFLQGRSGIGKTSYFQYLTDYYSDKKHDLLPKNVIPVFIPLSHYRENEPEKMFQSQLEKYGRLFDKDLSSWFLEQGIFLIFLDGLNEVSEAERQKINTFVTNNSQANYFCLSSQRDYNEFSELTIVQLASLGKREIKQLLEKKLGEAKTKDVLKQFNKSSYELYEIPQNLDFAIELIQNNKPLPKSQRALYQAILKPIFDEWEKNGKADFDDILYQKSYNMFINKDQFFNQSQPKVPDELRDELVKQKFLVKRTENYHFQHDLIRAYLASLYFTPRWQNLIKDDSLTIDENWRSLLEFSLNNFTQPEESKKLMLMIVEKNPSLAGKVFTSLQKTRPDLCETWSDEFFSQLGKQLNQQREDW